MGIIDAVEPWQDEPGEEQYQQTFQIFAQVYLAPSGNEDADQSDQTNVLFHRLIQEDFLAQVHRCDGILNHNSI